MSETSTPMNSAAPWHDQSRQPAGVATFDNQIFDDFVSLLGRNPARHWLDAFRSELLLEFSGGLPTETSRANIHHFCARAGLIGFDALHTACHDFLETRPGQDEINSTYQRLRGHADHARAEIERCCALLE